MQSERESGGTLLHARVHMEDIYQRQQGARHADAARRSPCPPFHTPCRRALAETIVSWNEPDTGVDYALSFQDPEGCTELWEQLCSLQGRSPSETANETEGPSEAAQSAEARGRGAALLPGAPS